MANEKIRNVAIIAHIDHGKTTLLDSILQQSGVFRANEHVDVRVMDSNDQEKERGITIFSKNTAVMYGDTKINFVDTPGHADFAGEVERVLKMVNGVLLLVDASEGPMPQTRFVLKKAMELHLIPIVVINKIDRPTSRPAEVHDEVLDLFIELGADENQIDFPTVYASAVGGYARFKPDDGNMDLKPLFQMIVDKVPAPEGDATRPFLMQVATLMYDDFVGKIACGRILDGTVKAGQSVTRVWSQLTNIGGDIVAEDTHEHTPEEIVERHDHKADTFNATGAPIEIHRAPGKVVKVLGFQGIKKVELGEGTPGDIVLLAGLGDPHIGDTIGDPTATTEPIAFVEIDQPTLSMNFMANTSPFAGRDGKHVTIRKIRERLERELKTNVSLRVESTDSSDSLKVSGRGELHLSVLIEAMRREGFELQVSRPQVITKRTADGAVLEPIEYLVLDLQEEYVGNLMTELGERRGEMVNMVNNGAGLVRLEYHVPTRGLLGLRSTLMNSTRGTGIMSHQFEKYDAWRGFIPGRNKGVLIAQESGKATPYAINNLQERSVFFIQSGVDVYEGMIVGENSRPDDMVVNIIKEKKLTNMRAAGSDDNVLLVPPRIFSLEQALEYINDDEFVEVTPTTIRLRKRYLNADERKKYEKREAQMAAAG